MLICIAGLSGHVTFVMLGTGAEMMTGVMVSACINICLIVKFLWCILTCQVYLLSAVVLFCSREHENCGPQPGYVGAHIESKLVSYSTNKKIFKVFRSMSYLQ